MSRTERKLSLWQASAWAPEEKTYGFCCLAELKLRLEIMGEREKPPLSGTACNL
jgi:hypothetical protein